MTKRIWLMLAVLAACTDVHGPQMGTQTGNPPVLDRGRVTLEVSADEVHIAGKSRAATPGGATIEVTNLTTGKVIEGMAAPDGSFDVRVDGSPNDAFVVRAVVDGESSTPVYVVRGGAEIAGEDDGSLACEQYPELGYAVLEASAASADRSCTTAADCKTVSLAAQCVPRCSPAYVNADGARQIEATIGALQSGLCASSTEEGCSYIAPPCIQPRPAACVAGQCTEMEELSCLDRSSKASEVVSQAISMADLRCDDDGDCTTVGRSTLCEQSCIAVPVSLSGKALVEAKVAEVNDGLCAPFRDGSCEREPFGCDPIAPPEPSCVSGQCTVGPRPLPDGGIPDCTTCFTEPLTWGWNGGFAAFIDSSALIPCARYQHLRKRQGDPNAIETSCERDLIACNSIASTGAVLTALGQDGVQRALMESPVLYGTDPRGVDGQVFRIKLGDKMIEVGGSCENAPPNCIPAPQGVTALVELLQDIDESMLATDECADFPR